MMKKKPLLIIPIETKVREFDAKLLLSVVALRKGFDVVVGSLWEIKYLTDLLDRGIFLDKSIAKTKQQWFRQCRQKGHRVAALDEEGLVYFDAETYRQLRIFSESMENADLFFAWGNDQAEVIAPAVGELNQRVRVTGNPRFDLLRPELRGLYTKEAAALQEEYGRIILINTSFSFANSANDSNALLQTFSQYPITEERPGFFEGWMAAQERVLQSFREMLPGLRERFQEHTVIIRPHPSEDLKLWQELAASMSKTQVIREGNVVPWILASDVLVHWNCTTAIEAMLLGVPAIAYRKEQPDLYEQPLPNACSFHATELDRLIEMIDQAVNDKLIASDEEAETKKRILQHHVSSLQGELAAEKMVNELFLLSQSFKRQKGLPEKSLQAMKRLWRSVLDQLDSSRHVRDKYIAGKFPDTGVDEVRDRVNFLANCLGYHADIVVKEECDNCFLLSTKI